MQPDTVLHRPDARGSLTRGRRRPVVRGAPDREQRTARQGHRALWTWHGAALTVATDRDRTLAPHGRVHRRGIAVASTATRLFELAAPRTLRREARGGGLNPGWYKRDSAPFVAIRVAPPGSASRWGEGRLQLSGGTTVVPHGSALGANESVATARPFATPSQEMSLRPQRIAYYVRDLACVARGGSPPHRPHAA